MPREARFAICDFDTPTRRFRKKAIKMDGHVAESEAEAVASAVNVDAEDETDTVSNQNKNQALVEEEIAAVASDLSGFDSNNIVLSPSTIETTVSKEVGIKDGEKEITIVMEEGDGGTAADNGEEQAETALNDATTEKEAKISSLSSSSSSSSSSSPDVKEQDGSIKQTYDSSTIDLCCTTENVAPGSGAGPVLLEDTTRDPNKEGRQQQPQIRSFSEDDGSVTRTSFKVVAGHDSVEIHKEGEEEKEQDQELSPPIDIDDDVAGENWMTGQKQEQQDVDEIATGQGVESAEEEQAVESKSETVVAAKHATSSIIVPSDTSVPKHINTSIQSPSTAGTEAGGRSHASQMITAATSEKIITATLSSLPNDSLHSIASFLTPKEWSNFSKCNKSTNKICRDVFRRVRLHGFKCATEVVTAWVS